MRIFLIQTVVAVLLFANPLSFSQQSPGSQSPTSPLSIADVEHGLKAGVTNTRMVALVKQYGVDFELTDAVEKQLQGEGANRELLLLIRSVSSESRALPSEDTVNAFLHSWFGYDSQLSWKILGIKPSVYGLAEVAVTLTGPKGPQVFKIYVTPDRRHAVNGDIIPFGAKPFAAYQKKLENGVNGPFRGPANAPVTIVEFSDLQCPHCKEVQPTIEQLMTKNTNVRLVFQDFPMPVHDWAARAAAYADCIARSSNDAFWKFIESVYGAQADITASNADEKLTALADQAGVKGQEIATCAVKSETTTRVQNSIDLGNSLDVNSTPTFFINGRKVPAVPYDVFQKLVDFAAGVKANPSQVTANSSNGFQDNASSASAGSERTQRYQGNTGSVSTSSNASTSAGAGNMSAVRTDDATSGGSGVDAHDCVRRGVTPGQPWPVVALQNACSKAISVYFCWLVDNLPDAEWGCGGAEIGAGRSTSWDNMDTYKLACTEGNPPNERPDPSCSHFRNMIWNAVYTDSKQRPARPNVPKRTIPQSGR